MDALTFVIALIAVLLIGLALGIAAGLAYARTAARAEQATWNTERAELTSTIAALEEEKTTADHLRTSEQLQAQLAPLNSALARLERRAQATESQTATTWGTLTEQLRHMHAYTRELGDTTSTLAQALRSSSARGAWGEVQLQRIVEHAGMFRHVDFTTQTTGTTSAGDTVRPDAIVNLPGGKHVVLDAKAPMTAFLAACEADTDENRAAAWRKHAKAVRTHVDTLRSKKYWTAIEPTPEFVVCFLPSEAMLSTACEHDPDLLEHAFGSHVVLATPATLLAVLRSVALTWQHERLAHNTQEVFAAGREVHARLATMAGHLTTLGASIGRTVKDYNKLVGSMEHRVFPGARKLADLGAADAALPEVPTTDETPKLLTHTAWEEPNESDEAAELPGVRAHGELGRRHAELG